MDNVDGKIPLGLCKQAVMKLDSLMTDLCEIKEDPDLDEEDRNLFETMIDVTGLMEANILNIVRKEMDEDEFLNVETTIDEFDEYPDKPMGDILDETI